MLRACATVPMRRPRRIIAVTGILAAGGIMIKFRVCCEVRVGTSPRRRGSPGVTSAKQSGGILAAFTALRTKPFFPELPLEPTMTHDGLNSSTSSASRTRHRPQQCALAGGVSRAACQAAAHKGVAAPRRRGGGHLSQARRRCVCMRRRRAHVAGHQPQTRET